MGKLSFKLWLDIMNYTVVKYLNSFVWLLIRLQMLFKCLEATGTIPFNHFTYLASNIADVYSLPGKINKLKGHYLLYY